MFWKGVDYSVSIFTAAKEKLNCVQGILSECFLVNCIVHVDFDAACGKRLSLD